MDITKINKIPRNIFVFITAKISNPLESFIANIEFSLKKKQKSQKIKSQVISQNFTFQVYCKEKVRK